MRALGSGIGFNADKGGGGGGRGSKNGVELPKPKLHFKKVRQQIWALVGPRKWMMLFAMCLMGINRVSGMVVPWISKTLLDKVLSPIHAHPELLPRIVAVVFAAMILQAFTSFWLTQLLAKAGQRLIAEMRLKVQRHVGLLSVSYYDENRTGVLVARIMSDVEGVRNLVGTGLVEFLGGIVTALLAFGYLLSRSVSVTLVVFAVLGVFIIGIQRAMRRIRPVFRERGRINAEVTGRLTESIGGVRVVKGYHAEEREARTFSAGIDRMLANAMKSVSMTSMLSTASASVLGLVSALVMWMGGHNVLTQNWTVGDYFSYNLFLAFMISPVFQMTNIGTQLMEALAGLDRTNEIMSEIEENQTPGTVSLRQSRTSS